ncbi:hypothetical protein F7725_005212 [Dissostichus mawsoni]|uniref:Uncharacterized protein n=1 Tax=Dissostichus mawsoni TaxID=36200 RepID=A0A7J5YTS0_DISMA|nr:hypothetical protein F7725_005212 [Dissostichus mawsoni]
MTFQSRRSSSSGKRRRAPRAPQSAGKKERGGTDRTPTPAVEPMEMCHQRGSLRSAGFKSVGMKGSPVSSGRPDSSAPLPP